MRILLAEDEPVVARLIAHVLESHGDGVEQVSSCAQAIDRLRAEQFDLVLLDLHLADGNAFRVVDAIESPPGEAPRVLLMTGDRLEDDDPRPDRIAGVLAKPFEVGDLERAIAALRAAD